MGFKRNTLESISREIERTQAELLIGKAHARRFLRELGTS